MDAAKYRTSNLLKPSLRDIENNSPTNPTKNKSLPPMEFIIPSTEPSLSSATVVSTLGHNAGVTGDLMEAKLKGPKKLFRNSSQPAKDAAKIAVDTKYTIPMIIRFLISGLQKNFTGCCLASSNLEAVMYKNVNPMVPSRKSKIYHHPLHDSVKRPVNNPPSAARMAIFSMLFDSSVSTNSHVTINGKKTTHASLSPWPNNVLPNSAGEIAIIRPAKNPPVLPATFLAIKN